MSNPADFIFFGGDIITIDDRNPIVEAVAIKGDKILATGNFVEVYALSGPSTQLIDLDSQTLLPGFIEPHQHAIHMANFRGLVNISGYYFDSYENIETKMKTEIAMVDTDKGDRVKWCLFYGWDPELIPDLPILSADFLDELSRDIPIAVIGQSFHIAWVNHKAFEIAGVDDNTQDVLGGVFARDQHGHLTGKLLGTSLVNRIIRHSTEQTTLEELRQAFKDQCNDYASQGFTTVTELLYNPKKDMDTILAEEAENCCVRLALYTNDDDQESYRSQFAFEASAKIWEAGVKLFADGSPHCGTAALREPYFSSDLTEILGFPNAPNCGSLNYTDDKLLETVEYFHKKGKQIAIHAHGERAVDQVISVYEQVLNKYPEPKDMRHRIEHLGLATADAISRAAQVNLALSFFVCHLYFYAKTFANFYLGEERTNRWTPLSVATKRGMRWTIHQDNPAFPCPPLPFANMKTAVTRTQRDDSETVFGREYRVSIDEAVKAYTINAAWQLHKDDVLGSLTENKKADLVILSQNPYKVDPFQLEDIQVIDTFLDGRSINASHAYMTCSVRRPEGNCLIYKEKNNVNQN